MNGVKVMRMVARECRTAPTPRAKPGIYRAAMGIGILTGMEWYGDCDQSSGLTGILWGFLNRRLIKCKRCKYVVVVVVVTFFNDNFVNCQAILILEMKNLPINMQYKPK